jgi:hypothetical protein
MQWVRLTCWNFSGIRKIWGCVQMPQVLIPLIVEKLDRLHHILLNDGPTLLEENIDEAIRPRSLITCSINSHNVHFIFSERLF